MTDHTSIERRQETERLLGQAIAEAPLTATTSEVAAALQAISLKIAEQCLEPRDIARVLIGQAEAYLKAAGAHVEPPVQPEPLTTDAVVHAGHAALTTAVTTLRGCGLPDIVIREMMLGFAVTWAGQGEPAETAALLYRHADALAGRAATSH